MAILKIQWTVAKTNENMAPVTLSPYLWAFLLKAKTCITCKWLNITKLNRGWKNWLKYISHFNVLSVTKVSRIWGLRCCGRCHSPREGVACAEFSRYLCRQYILIDKVLAVFCCCHFWWYFYLPILQMKMLIRCSTWASRKRNGYFTVSPPPPSPPPLEVSFSRIFWS